MPGLRLALDVTPLLTGRTGVARATGHLANALAARPDVVAVAPFALGRAVVDGPLPPATRRLRVPLRLLDRWWQRGHGPTVERLVGPVASVHASGPVLPPTRQPLVGVVHDLAPLDHPELHPARDVDQLRRYVDGLHRCAAVVTVSAATADRLVARRPGLAVTVVPNGRTPLPEPVAPPLAGRPYVLAVGAPVPRKDLGTLLTAVARLEGTEAPAVVVVGPPGSADDALARQADELGLTAAGRWHRITDADDARLAGWYAHAAAVAVTSVEEGFSLPVVEAQAAGRPVVATDLAVHREVGGGATWAVPVGDAGAVADALAAVLAGGRPVAELVAAGRTNAARFTWAAAADAVLAVHRSLW